MNSYEELYGLKLVQNVEKYPVLYNFKLGDYSKREAVDAAWENVAKAMNDTAVNCKDKWRNIRTVMSRKLKPLPSSARRSKIKPYYLMESLQFLIPFMGNKYGEISGNLPSPPESQGNPETNEEINNDEWTLEHPRESGTCEADVQYKASKKRKQTVPVSAVDAAFIKYIERKNKEPKENSRRMFLLSLLPDVEKLNDNKMRKFRRRVVDILDSLLDDETPGSYVTWPEISEPRTPRSTTSSNGVYSVPSTSTPTQILCSPPGVDMVEHCENDPLRNNV